MKTCRNCGKEFKQLVVIDGVERNLSKRRYCLECSPFGRRNRKILESQGRPRNGVKFCSRCKETKPLSEFYPKRTTEFTSYCKICTGMESKQRQWKFKKACLEYKGARCTRCGYSRCISALDFHHLDAGAKEFTISRLRFYTFSDKVKAELDKCIVLCANCHREEHAGNIEA